MNGSIRPKEFSDVYFNIAFIPDNKEKSILSVGIMKPGRHEFEHPVMRDEIIKVTFGAIAINGTLCREGEEYIVSPGTKIVFEADELSSCRCTFPGETR